MRLSAHCALTLGLFSLGGGTASSAGTFENPHSQSRPRFRYWLPDASVDGEVVAHDIKAAGAIGAGGVEFLPFFNYGGDHGPQPEGADWSTFAFGSPAYRDLLVDALRAHKESGLFMDIAIGPNQGQGVPANPDDEGLQWDLIPYTAEVPANGSFDGLIPGWEKNDGELIAAVSACVVSEREDFLTSVGFDGYRNITWTEYTIDHNSLADITADVDTATGQLSATFHPEDNCRIFSFYQRLSGNHNVHFENDRNETIFDHGSFAVDHHSARGAQTVIDLWEKHILDDEVMGLLKDAANYMWEDSIEIIANITWSPSLPRRFEERFGYSLFTYLPLLSWGHNNLAMQKTDPGEFRALLDTKYEGAGFINDFRVILTEGYLEYLQTLRDWANDRLGIQFSTQPSYGFPQDMAVSVPIPDAPECESLTFMDKIDAYRQFAGPAHLTGKNIISNEVGAVALKAYSYENRELMWSVNRAVAGGVNQFIIHGQSYSGDYFGTTWPGYTAFLYLFSELYMEKQPAWNNGLEDVLNYISRLQFVQRQGTPKVDVAVLNKQSANNQAFPLVYPDADLQSEGWTYTYLTDLNLDLPEASVVDGILSPNGPAWKAFVVEASQNITVDTVERLRKLSQAGLPVIISGTPGYYPVRSTCSEGQFQHAFSSLVEEANVHQVNKGHVAQKLGELGLSPQTKSTNASWYTTWRVDEALGIDYAFVFNDGDASTGEATFRTKKKPFALDPWTGERTEVSQYTLGDGTVTIPIEFAADQSKLFAFEGEYHACHITSVSAIVAATTTDSAIRIYSQSAGEATLSTGKQLSIPSAAATFKLGNWSLVASHWERPSDLYDVDTIALKRNTTHDLPSSTLPSWKSIAGLEDTSGVGYYTTTFSWPPAGDASGAYISFPTVTHGLTVYVNSERVPTFDHHAPMRDITPYLRHGTNEVLAVVPSTMWNYLRTIMGDLRSGGEKSSLITRLGGNLPDRVDSGIIGSVEVIPFSEVQLSC
ncbi:hypothetical protein F5X68DRAFT_128816 [Plectosphaerella plurivora]|uniref:Secreted protein n=1 Tax=Plectosphaerella plurivora TaxID=936078 RepID=A0A9P8VIT2_9PEZI|nr:hypothetical protein F5X68DRAFT_128816 [Plectosphaerella plurivora]